MLLLTDDMPELDHLGPEDGTADEGEPSSSAAASNARTASPPPSPLSQPPPPPSIAVATAQTKPVPNGRVNTDDDETTNHDDDMRSEEEKIKEYMSRSDTAVIYPEEPGECQPSTQALPRTYYQFLQTKYPISSS